MTLIGIANPLVSDEIHNHYITLFNLLHLFFDFADSFSRRDGTSINYAQYYKEKYNVNIRDMSQPMLLSMPKDRDRRGGNDEPIRLPPEVCNFTGLSEEQRNNFRLKQDLASDLMKDPNQRVQALRDLSSRMRNTVECVQAMRNWDMDLDQELVTVQGRQLQPVPIIYNDRQRGKEYSPDNADWTSCKPMVYLLFRINPNISVSL